MLGSRCWQAAGQHLDPATSLGVTQSWKQGKVIPAGRDPGRDGPHAYPTTIGSCSVGLLWSASSWLNERQGAAARGRRWRWSELSAVAAVTDHQAHEPGKTRVWTRPVKADLHGSYRGWRP